ncbi:hypothetical protein PIB30_006608 [Stylosanthes scabra]|uniref:VQ domain-containing protein n=1 Tax=Stylosanthes scabra TaxID=79078 RepID=A0ABU6Z6A3_9FABA|nr:hypothetical protein [Stylosanthes scabra]
MHLDRISASRGVASLTCRPHVGLVILYGHTRGKGYPEKWSRPACLEAILLSAGRSSFWVLTGATLSLLGRRRVTPLPVGRIIMSGYGGGSSKKGPVKVVIINTQYVETDATSFKSVVQKLTGKDSFAEGDHGKPHHQLRDHRHHQMNNYYYNHNNNNNNHVADSSTSSAGNNGFVNQFLIRDVSFKEFDSFFGQIPPINDIWSD